MVYSTLLSIAGWSFVPKLATHHALRIVHRFYPQILGASPPAPGTSAYKQHFRYTYAVVILGYLFYNFLQGSRSMVPNFYEVLGVPPDVDENGLKLAFRQFARKYHPDKVGPQGEALFMDTRDAFEALKNPTVRFAYDRFGPDVLQWSKLSTAREYLRHGLMQSAGYHIVTALSLFVISSIGQTSPVKFWRYLLFVAIFASELSFLLYPSPSSTSIFSMFSDPADGPTYRSILHIIFPQRVAYQHILFLHQIFLFLSLALTKVAPAMFPADSTAEHQALMQQINSLAAMGDREASVMLHTEIHSIHSFIPENRVSATQIHPFSAPSSDVMDALTKEMENMIIETNVKKGAGPLRSVWEAAVVRQRALSDACGLKTSSHPDDEDVSPPSSAIDGEGNLPSPRPSPPPSLLRRGSSYTRARSVSWS